MGPLLGPFGTHLGPTWGHLGAILGQLGGILGPFGGQLGSFRACVDHVGAYLRPFVERLAYDADIWAPW